MSFCHLSKQSCTGFVGAFNIVFCTVNLQRERSALPKCISMPFFLWSIFEGMTFQGIQFEKFCLQHLSVLFNSITQVSAELMFRSSLLVVDFIVVALIFPTATKSHIGTCYYVASQMLKPVKYKLSLLKALMAECHLLLSQVLIK